MLLSLFLRIVHLQVGAGGIVHHVLLVHFRTLQDFVDPALVHDHAAVGDLADLGELGGENDDGLAALGQPERERDLLERAEMVYEGT